MKIKFVRYLLRESDRVNAILEGLPPSKYRFKFNHQDTSQIPKYRNSRIHQNLIQWNKKAGSFVR